MPDTSSVGDSKGREDQTPKDLSEDMVGKKTQVALVTSKPLVEEQAHTPEVTLMTQELSGSSSDGMMGAKDLVSQAMSKLMDKILESQE